MQCAMHANTSFSVVVDLRSYRQLVELMFAICRRAAINSFGNS
jgi:hypothetical protein